jgi:hypothetical protein
MGNTAAHGVPTQAPEDRILRPAHVQDGGQSKLTGKAKLRLKKTLLTDSVEPWDKMIEPDFANRYQSGIVAMALKRHRQLLEVRVLRAIDKERVNPECVSPTRHPLRKQPDRIEITGLDRRDDDTVYACTMARGDNRVPI